MAKFFTTLHAQVAAQNLKRSELKGLCIFLADTLNSLGIDPLGGEELAENPGADGVDCNSRSIMDVAESLVSPSAAPEAEVAAQSEVVDILKSLIATSGIKAADIGKTPSSVRVPLDVPAPVPATGHVAEPVEYTPAVEIPPTPVVETPVVETPVVEVVEMPVVESPAVVPEAPTTEVVAPVSEPVVDTPAP